MTPARPAGRPSGPRRSRASRDTDAIAGRVAAELLERSHLLTLDSIASALTKAARPLGISRARIYLADLQQRHLTALPDDAAHDPATLGIDSTTAGQAYRSIRIQVDLPVEDGDERRVWVPLVDGTERLGVLELITRDAGQDMLDRYRMLASLAGLMIVSKSSYSDTYARTQRSREMTLQAELVRAFMAPPTFATERVLIAAALEPAYDVGGDAFDYSLLGDRLHVSVFDAAGHDLAAGLLASVAMASCRSTRRSGGTLPDIVARADHAISRQFGADRFVTALLCDLNLTTGQLTWIPCGHPPPLLIRGRQMIKELARKPQLPLGLAGLGETTGNGKYSGDPYGETAAPVYAEQLQPGDRVLLYTDGVTDARAADGTAFGVEGLSDFIIRHTNAGTRAPETLRRLNRAIIEYQHGRLADDSTIVLLEWMPEHPGHHLTP
jgi:hypothetical protein